MGVYEKARVLLQSQLDENVRLSTLLTNVQNNRMPKTITTKKMDAAIDTRILDKILGRVVVAVRDGNHFQSHQEPLFWLIGSTLARHLDDNYIGGGDGSGSDHLSWMNEKNAIHLGIYINNIENMEDHLLDLGYVRHHHQEHQEQQE